MFYNVPMKVLGNDWDPSTRVLLADGAWGTEFLKRGLAFGDAPEEWNLSRPEVPREIAGEYLAAGSELILTNTFGANRFQLQRHKLDDKTIEINRRGAELTKEAAGGKAVTLGDIGPSGKLLVMEEVTADELYESFREQAQALKDGGAEWIVIETMTDYQEMSLAVKAAKDCGGLTVVASMTYEKGNQGYRTVMGNSPEECVSAAIENGADIIGANCGTGVDAYVDLAIELKNLSDRPLWIKGNAGLPEIVNGQTKYRMSSETYGTHVKRLLDVGVNIIGGCCGTGPEYIAVIRKILDKWNK